MISHPTAELGQPMTQRLIGFLSKLDLMCMCSFQILNIWGWGLLIVYVYL